MSLQFTTSPYRCKNETVTDMEVITKKDVVKMSSLNVSTYKKRLSLTTRVVKEFRKN